MSSCEGIAEKLREFYAIFQVAYERGIVFCCFFFQITQTSKQLQLQALTALVLVMLLSPSTCHYALSANMWSSETLVTQSLLWQDFISSLLCGLNFLKFV